MVAYEDLDLRRDFPVIPLPDGFTIHSVSSLEDCLKKHHSHGVAFNVADIYPEDNFRHLSDAPHTGSLSTW